MQIEIGAPTSLPLAAICFEDEGAGLLGVTLRHPPLNLSARASEVFSAEGARGERAQAFGRQFLRHYQLPEQGQIEIELATPSHMGLGSDATLALGVAQGLAWVHGRPHDDAAALAEAAGLGPAYALETHAYAQGGMLLVEAPNAEGAAPRVLRRQAVAHREEEAWAFVLFLPRVPAGTPDSLEADRRAALLKAMPHLSQETGKVLAQALWPRLAEDNFDGFAQALREIQSLNAAALEAAGVSAPLTAEERGILALYEANGAAVWGRSLGGLALYALIQGKTPSIALRKAVTDRVGYQGGTVMAAIVDNDGARNVVHEGTPIYTGASPLVTGKAKD
jgi:predicted sugar kinase